MTSSCIGTHAVGPLPDFLGLGKPSWAWEWHFLGWVGGWPAISSEMSMFPWKNGIFGLETSIILWFFGLLWMLDEPDLLKTGCEVEFGRRGKLTCHRTDELFKPNCRTRAPQSPRRPPGDPPRIV